MKGDGLDRWMMVSVGALALLAFYKLVNGSGNRLDSALAFLGAAVVFGLMWRSRRRHRSVEAENQRWRMHSETTPM